MPVPVRTVTTSQGEEWAVGTRAGWYAYLSFVGVPCWRHTSYEDPYARPTAEQVQHAKDLACAPERIEWLPAAPAHRLYNETEAENIPPGFLLVIAEGESDCDRLALEGVVAVTNHGGAGALDDATAARLQAVAAGRWVVIAMDQDRAGEARAEALGALLSPHAARTTVWAPARAAHLSTPKGYDVRDWLDEHPEEAVDLPDHFEDAPDWSPGIASHLLVASDARSDPSLVKEAIPAEAPKPSSGVTLMDDALSWFADEISAEHSALIDFDLFYGTGVGASPVPFTLRAGEVAMFFGDTKLGKSALMANLAYLLSSGITGHPRRRVLDCSLEMPKRDLVERYLQIAHGLREGSNMEGDTFHEVRRALMGETIHLADGNARTFTRDQLLAPLRGISMLNVTDAPLSFERLEEVVASCSAEVVIIDTPESLEPPVVKGRRPWDGPQAVFKTFEALMGLAERLRICVLIVQHINKTGQKNADGSTLPAIGDIKGLSTIAQKVSFCVAYGGDRATHRRSIALRARRRTQNLGASELHFAGDPLTMRFLREVPRSPDEPF